MAGRDHGGGLDDAVARFGGVREDWIDLSTGINPIAYPLPEIDAHSWNSLPDRAAQDRLTNAARRFWNVPEGASILAAPGASCLIANIPSLTMPGQVNIPQPTYNEHAAAFSVHGWRETQGDPDARVIVHPNNPTGAWYTVKDLTAPLTIVDESFCDVAPENSLISFAARGDVIVLKSFGKFWGLAGLRLGFAIGPAALISQLSDRLGPWPVSGPALTVGATALEDNAWASKTRERLDRDAARLDTLMVDAGAKAEGGTSLFRLYHVDDATIWQERFAQHHIWSRIFPYSRHWLRLGLPGSADWSRIEAAL